MNIQIKFLRILYVTALHIAIKRSDEQIVQILLSCERIDVNHPIIQIILIFLFSFYIIIQLYSKSSNVFMKFNAKSF